MVKVCSLIEQAETFCISVLRVAKVKKKHIYTNWALFANTVIM